MKCSHLSYAAATPPPSSSDVGSQHQRPSTSPAQPPPQNQRLPAGDNDNDEGEDEPAFVHVLPAVTLQLWNSLLERRGYQIADGELIHSPSKMKAGPQKMKLKPPLSPHRPEIPGGQSVISSFRRANSFAPVAREASSSRPMPFKRAATSAAVFAVHDAQAGPSTSATVPRLHYPSNYEATPPADCKTSVPTRGVFAGMIFRILGEAKIPTVRNAIEEQGGRISTVDEEEVTFVIVRLVRSDLITLVSHELIVLQWK